MELNLLKLPDEVLAIICKYFNNSMIYNGMQVCYRLKQLIIEYSLIYVKYLMCDYDHLHKYEKIGEFKNIKIISGSENYNLLNYLYKNKVYNNLIYKHICYYGRDFYTGEITDINNTLKSNNIKVNNLKIICGHYVDNDGDYIIKINEEEEKKYIDTLHIHIEDNNICIHYNDIKIKIINIKFLNNLIVNNIEYNGTLFNIKYVYIYEEGENNYLIGILKDLVEWLDKISYKLIIYCGDLIIGDKFYKFASMFDYQSGILPKYLNKKFIVIFDSIIPKSMNKNIIDKIDEVYITSYKINEELEKSELDDYFKFYKFINQINEYNIPIYSDDKKYSNYIKNFKLDEAGYIKKLCHIAYLVEY